MNEKKEKLGQVEFFKDVRNGLEGISMNVEISATGEDLLKMSHSYINAIADASNISFLDLLSDLAVLDMLEQDSRREYTVDKSNPLYKLFEEAEKANNE